MKIIYKKIGKTASESFSSSVKNQHHGLSLRDAGFLCHLWFCDAADIEHCLYGQAHSDFESQGKCCDFIDIVELRGTVFLLLEHSNLCLRKRSLKVFLIPRQQMHQLRVLSAFNHVPFRRCYVAVVQLFYDTAHVLTSLVGTDNTREARE